MKKILFFLFIPILLFSSDTHNKDLFALLDEAEAYATQTKININDMPSSIEVLRQRELRELGIRDLAEALSLTVGIEVTLSSAGQPITIIRGVKSPDTFSLDKIKLMIDGVDVSSLHNATIEYYLSFPIDLVSRIEILKSPGSAMYGTDAFLGVVNIVTISSEANQNSVTLGAGSYEYRYGAFQASIKETSYALALDGYYQKNEKYLDAKGFSTYPERLGRAEESDERLRDFSIGLNATYDNFSLKSRIKRKRSGIFYDVQEDLYSGNNDEHLTREYFFSELSYTAPLSEGNTLVLSAGYDYHDGDFIFSQQMNDVQYLFYQQVLPGFGSDMYSYTHVREEGYYGKLEFNSKAIDHHTVTLGAYYKQTKNTHNRAYVEPYTKEKYEILSVYNPNYLIMDGSFYDIAHPTRDVGALYVQDLIELSPSIDIQLGFRIDHYKDELSQPSYKIGAVYAHNDYLNSKISYATGFRAPTWSELYRVGDGSTILKGNSELEPEMIETYEYNLIYNQDSKHEAKLNLYYTNLHNTIDRAQSELTFFNARDYVSKGIELSYRAHLFLHDLLTINYAYNDTQYHSEDGSYVQQTPDVAQHLANIYYIIRPSEDLSLSLHYRYTGERETNKIMEPADERYLYEQNYPANNVFNTTLSYRYQNLCEVMLSVRNLFDSKIINPSSRNRHYETGLVREGRNYMLEATFFMW